MEDMHRLNQEDSYTTIDEIIENAYAKQNEHEQMMISKKYAVLDRVVERAKRFGVTIPQDVLNEIGQLVMTVKGGVAVTTRRAEKPTVAKCGNMILEYSLEEADREKTKRPYLLSLWFMPDSESLVNDGNEAMDIRTMRLKSWLDNKKIPFISEILERVDQNKDMMLQVYKDLSSFGLEVAKLGGFSDDDFVGQKVKNCRRISKSTAVGIVKNNVVIIYAPAWGFEKSTWTFYVR